MVATDVWLNMLQSAIVNQSEECGSGTKQRLRCMLNSVFFAMSCVDKHTMLLEAAIFFAQINAQM